MNKLATPVETVETQAREIRNALPDAVKEQIARQKKGSETERWGSGRLASEMVDELCSSHRYSKTAVRLAIAWEYDVTESTIRERERIARIVTDEMREAHPVLTFHYWRAAVNGGDKMMEIVNQVEEYAEAWGYKPSLGQVFGWLHDNGDLRPIWRYRIDNLLSACERIVGDPLTPGGIRELLDALIEGIGKLLAGL